MIEPLQRHPLHSTAAILEAALKDMGAAKGSKLPETSPMAALRPIIVYGLSDVRAACQAALEQGMAGLAIMTPSGVAHSLGPQWFKHLLQAARQAYAELKITAIMDCGPYEGHVMNALNSGLKDVYYHGDDESAEKLGWIAAKTGANIHRKFKDILDLKGEGDQLAACREWFSKPSRPRARV
ncbi:MAG TPA: hypothetical protein DIS76_05845 [Rhodospirillaceae bacterium]|nr:hypothetical protein [Rhodospirillaceae bacterium]